MAKKTKCSNLSIDERLEQALIPKENEPYKLPDNWCWVRLGSINSYAGRSVDPSKAPADMFELYSVPSSADNYPEIVSGNEIGSTKQAVEKDDVLLCKINPRINRVWKVSKHTEYALLASSEWIIIRNKNIVSDFLMWCLQSPYFREFMLSNVSGIGGSLMRAQPKHVQNYPIPLPPAPEQRRIVERLESLFAKLDEAKEKAKEVVEGFEVRKAAIFQKAFSGELTAKWREENGVSLESWMSVSIADVCTVNPKKIDTRDLPDNLEVSFFPMPALSEIYGEITQPQTRLLKEVKNGFTNFKEGDVVFAKITPCMENGKSAVIGKLVNDIGYGTTEFYVFRCGEKLFNRYIYHLLRSKLFRDQAKQVMTGAVGQQRVPKSFVEQYPVLLPSLPEQHEIVNILDRMLEAELKTKETAELVIDQIDTMKKSILARVFRGELGTNDPTEGSSVELLKSIVANGKI